MVLIFKIHDDNGPRLQTACRLLEKLLRKYGIDGQVVAVSEYLEHCRLGVAQSLPALQLGGYILGKGFELTQDRLEDLCKRMSKPSVGILKKVDVTTQKRGKIDKK